MKRLLILTIFTLWGPLAQASEDFCKTGLYQSPVDIEEVEETTLSPISFISQPIKNSVVINATNYYAYPQNDIVLVRAGKRHKLLQFHMHTPADHRVKDHLYPLEIHFVFEDGPDHLLVLGQFATTGNSQSKMNELLYYMAVASNEVGETKVTFEMDPTELISDDLSYYQYEGSLTTAPCSQNVTWMVLAQPVEVSNSQIKDFKRLVGTNSRIPQPLNGRAIYASP